MPCREDGLLTNSTALYNGYGLGDDWFEGALLRPDIVLSDVARAINSSSVPMVGDSLCGMLVLLLGLCHCCFLLAFALLQCHSCPTVWYTLHASFEPELFFCLLLNLTSASSLT